VVIERLLSRTVKSPTTGCYLWTGGTSGPSGYGKINIRRDCDGIWRMEYVHRVAYELFVGPIPDGLHIDHLCRTQRCWNPGHLEAVTPAENVRRSLPFRNLVLPDACRYGHPYDEANTRRQRDGSRACRECQRQAQARYRARKAAA
jgi:hypothetical protein